MVESLHQIDARREHRIDAGEPLILLFERLQCLALRLVAGPIFSRDDLLQFLVRGKDSLDELIQIRRALFFGQRHAPMIPDRIRKASHPDHLTGPPMIED